MSRATPSHKTDVLQPDDIEIPASGDVENLRAKAATELNEQVVEPEFDVAGVSAKAEKLAFLCEKVTVMLAEESDPNNPEPLVFLSVNGRGPMPGGSPWVPRGVPVVMERYYVEGLARAKPISVQTVDALDADNFKTKKIRRTSALRYPFTVIEDRNPRGSAWVRNLLARRV